MPDDSRPAQHVAVLKVERLAVAAGHKRLLEGLDLELKAGERMGLTGPSGCGKTTLLRCLSTLTRPTGGKILLEGRRPRQFTWPGYRRRVVLVAQRPALLEDTVWRNLARPFEYRSAGRGDDAEAFPIERAKALLDAFELGAECLDQAAPSLSEGQQQRVCLIRALLLNPRVLLLDEPTSALDEESAALVEDAVARACRESGLACLIVSHDRRQVARWCHRHVDLRDYRAGDGAAAPDGADDAADDGADDEAGEGDE